MSGLNVEHIWHKFGDRMLLRDIALKLQAGECCCLLGKSDSGKSTLLSQLKARCEKEHLDVCLTAAPFALPRGTVEDALRRALHMKGADAALTEGRLCRLLDAFDLNPVRHLSCRDLSATRQECLAVALAVASRPAVLLLDGMHSLNALLPALRPIAAESGMAVLCATQDVHSALRHADTVALLHDGRILQHDTPQQVFAHPATLDAAQLLYPCAVIPGTVKGVREKDSRCMLDANGLEIECPCPDGTETGDRMTLLIPCRCLHLSLHPLPFGQNAAGKVTDVHFAFDEEAITLLLPGGTSVTALRRTEKSGKTEIGDRLFLCWDVQSCHLYPDAPVV